ncbi:TorF family putative porin [uncultured Amphritea sp.]|uniref:TorF family putative porin n=1 Tax=uncultured Amphritea sp. TaxID=981605 RepID=UPI0026271DFD|nr:TorF family putative porin [uncultured Amphritea sp.]
MKHFKSIAAIGLSLLSVSGLARAELGANVSVLSEWRNRGVSMTNESLAIQGGIDWYNQSGLFASVWASNVDFFANSTPKCNTRLCNLTEFLKDLLWLPKTETFSRP